jgi:acetyl esterase
MLKNTRGKLNRPKNADRLSSFSCLLAWVFLSLCTAKLAIAYEIDDSYTVSSALKKYQPQYPNIQPVSVHFKGKVEFDRLYHQLGKRELHLDLFHPPQGHKPKATIVMVHGGGWRAGDKSLFYPMASTLAEKGYLAVPIEYRRSLEAKYPSGLQDIQAALFWLTQHAQQLGIDPEKMVIMGGSSGGHMATLIGNRFSEKLFWHSHQEYGVPVSAIIDLDGVLDVSQGLGLQREDKNGRVDSMLAQWLDGNFASQTDRWKAVSTALHIHPKSPPLLVIRGKQPRFTAGYPLAFKKLKQFGIDHQLVSLRDAPHSFWLFHPWFEQVVEQTDQFIIKNVVQDSH